MDSSSINIQHLVEKYLKDYNIEHEIIEIDPDFADTAAFCEKYNYPVENSGNTIIVASKKEPKSFVACLVLASYKLDVNKTVRKLMEVSKVSFASAEDTKNLTGMMIGGVTIFGLPDNLTIYLDDKLFQLDYLIVGSGSRSTKVKINPEELKKIPNSIVISDLSY
ncbi:MAG: hypothetical protein MK012_02220 [Dehalococcoidia bacterium]|jgi:prolyl-tRNA editing enzyme YbaK/EbsC (Cys-tRNA(Pro) deacylase)|nr:hypothetical protein [Dehalococcoidia bacterium]|tara:strand:+ start:198 stop:692 length:495 start_codon:yes stop_codon:yes gene_type:complete